MAWSLDENERKTLESLRWSPELLDSLAPTEETRNVDRMFMESTRKALGVAGYTALKFLDANPGLSESELIDRLGRGASGFGLLMTIYEEAEQAGCIREVARDLLVRKIVQKLPNGWASDDDGRPSAWIGLWDSSIRRYVSDRQCGKYAANIVRHLTVDHPPPDGWKPQSNDDPLIDELFRRYWPREGSNNQRGAAM